jgi:uncharacterized membrane protein YgdD (TMEM256/DUF423 family)
MIRIWLAMAGLGGLVSVAAGALGAHAAGDPKTAELLRTGALYGMVHAVALLAVIAMAQGPAAGRIAITVAGWTFTAGIIMFSFSLFGLAAGAPRWLGWITPLGGIGFMLGWVALGSLAWRWP